MDLLFSALFIGTSVMLLTKYGIVSAFVRLLNWQFEFLPRSHCRSYYWNHLYSFDDFINEKHSGDWRKDEYRSDIKYNDVRCTVFEEKVLEYIDFDESDRFKTFDSKYSSGQVTSEMMSSLRSSGNFTECPDTIEPSIYQISVPMLTNSLTSLVNQPKLNIRQIVDRINQTTNAIHTSNTDRSSVLTGENLEFNTPKVALAMRLAQICGHLGNDVFQAFRDPQDAILVKARRGTLLDLSNRRLLQDPQPDSTLMVIELQISSYLSSLR
jgi:hypothetical protein